MYCDLNDAYNNSGNLLYDKELDNCHPEYMINAQSDFEKYGGTPIDKLKISDKLSKHQVEIPQVIEYESKPKEVKNNVELSSEEKEQIKHLVNESFNDINKTQAQKIKKIIPIQSDVKDVIFLTFIGIALIFLLDLLIRIGRKL
jgi:predicted metal-dependent RNase